MASSVKAAAPKRQTRPQADSESKRRVAGDDSYYTFVLQRYDGVVLPDVAIRLPSVTSIIKSVMGASGGGMAYWGFKLGAAAAAFEFHGEEPTPEYVETLYTTVKAGPYAPNKQRDKAGDRGNAAHDVLEGLARGNYSVVDQSSAGLWMLKGPGGIFTPDAYGQGVIEWWIAESPEVIATEQVLYSMTHRYSGSVDLIARRSDGRALVTDLKTHKPATSNGPAYSEDRIQVAAYRQAWTEMFPDIPLDGTSVLLACEDGTWKEDYRMVGFEVFAALRQAYGLLNEGGSK